MSPGKEIGISDLPSEILKENIYSKSSGNWEELLSASINNDLENNIPGLYDLYVQKLETILLRNSLEICKGKKIIAAQKLGIGRNTITRKIKDLNI